MVVYPPKGRAKRTQWGQLDSLSILNVIEKPKLNFQKHVRGSAFLKPRKPLSPEGKSEANPISVFFARGKSEKSAREAQQLPVANQQIKKFHGQFGHIWGKFP